MPTKAELIDFGAAHGVTVDDTMLKTDIEAKLTQAGYDPVTLQPTNSSQEAPMSESQTPPAEQSASQPDTQEAPSASELGLPEAEEGHPADQPFHFPVGDGEDQWDPEATTEKGWFGSRPMRHPDEEYTLASGPDAPTGVEGAE